MPPTAFIPAQMISLAVVSVSLLPFLAGRYAWSEAAQDLLAVSTSFSWPAIKLAFAVTFAWPDFAIPRFGVYLGISASFIAAQYAIKGMKALLGAADYYAPLLNSPGPLEERLWGLFGAVSWKPFRAASDLVRTALETTFTARKGFLQIVYGGWQHRDMFPSLVARTMERMPNALLVLFGPFLVVFSHPRCKLFKPDATDEDLFAFFSDESCMAYDRLVAMDNNKLTGNALTAIMKCPWLKALNLRGCSGIEGRTADMGKSLPNLIQLDMNRCTGITGALGDLPRVEIIK